MIFAVAHNAYLAKFIMCHRLGFQPSEFICCRSDRQFRGLRGPIKVFLLPGYSSNRVWKDYRTQAVLHHVREVELIYITDELLNQISQED